MPRCRLQANRFRRKGQTAVLASNRLTVAWHARECRTNRALPPPCSLSMAVNAATRRAVEIDDALARLYPAAECALKFRGPLQLLVATILSAQCTDERVNLVTRDLFRRYRTAHDFAQAPPADLEEAVRSTGFFRNKAKNIQACCRAIVDEHGGEVPRELDALVRLGGVGRKTANVVLGTAFGIASGVVVDTHVMRLSRRLGLTKRSDPVKIERDLMSLLPPSSWIDFSHRLIWHGRKVCTARKPACSQCALASLCPQIGVAAASTPIPTPTSRPAATRAARSSGSSRAARSRS